MSTDTLTETQIVPAEAQKLAEDTEAFLQIYDNFQITTAEVYAGAGEDLRQIKAKAKELDTLRKSLTRPLDESKKRIMDFFQKPLGLLKQAETAVSSAMINWHREQERIRQAEEARLREAQRKETERLAKLAAKAEERGDKEKAETFEERAAVVQESVPVVVPKVSKVAGLAMTKIWKFRITDASKIPPAYLMPNEVLLGQLARSTKGELKIEGVEFYSEDSMRGVRG